MRASLRIPILFAALFALICAIGLALLYRNRGPNAIADEGAPRLVVCWTAAVEDICHLTTTRDGGFVGVVASDGSAACYDPTGKVRWRARVPGADALVISPGGAYALLYTALNPAAKRLTFLDSEGGAEWSMSVSGAIWSADACDMDGGARFVVGTGENYIYVIDVSETRKRYRRWRVSGAVSSVEIDPAGGTIWYGCWQDSAIGCLTTKGRHLWRRNADQSRLHFVEALTSGKRLLLRSRPNAKGFADEFALLDGGGDRIWGQQLDPNADCVVVCSSDGRYTCVGYTREIRHEGKSARENHAALYDASGARLWDKGSLFFDPRPVMVTSAGYVIACAGRSGVFIVGPGGDPQPALTLPAAVNRSLPSRDGSRVLLQCADGKLRMLLVGA